MGKIVVEKSIEALEFGLLGDLFFVPWDDSWWLMVSFFGWIPSYEKQDGRRGLSWLNSSGFRFQKARDVNPLTINQKNQKMVILGMTMWASVTWGVVQSLGMSSEASELQRLPGG